MDKELLRYLKQTPEKPPYVVCVTPVSIRISCPADTSSVVACLIIFTVAGVIMGQVRTLQKFGYLANAAVWMNLFIIFMT